MGGVNDPRDKPVMAQRIATVEPLTPERFSELVEEGRLLRTAVERACRPGRWLTADDLLERSR